MKQLYTSFFSLFLFILILVPQLNATAELIKLNNMYDTNELTGKLNLKDKMSFPKANSLRPAAPSVSATVNSTNVTGCNGNNNGSIIFSNATGGSGTYEYSIDAGNTWKTTSAYTSLIAGTYNVQIRDANSISNVNILNSALAITQPIQLNATLGSTNVSTCGGSDGTITISAPTGGSGTYEYSKDGGNSWQSTGSFAVVPAGNYFVKMRDKNNPSCMWTSGTTITQPSSLTATNNSSAASTCSSMDASITISSPSGGSGTFEYSINNGYNWFSTGSFTNLLGGIYSIMIRDKNSPACFKTLVSSLDLYGPGAVKANFTTGDVSSCGGSNGTITISGVTGGAGIYEYSKDDGKNWQSTGSFAGLMAGGYGIRVRDKNTPSCYWSNWVNINQPSNLTASYTSSAPTTCSSKDASINISSPSGGSGTYEYSINYGYSWEASGGYTNLSGGNYSLMIRDKTNPSCSNTIASNLNLNGPGAVNANFNSTDVTTCGGSNGSITISNATGGSGTYEYSKDDGITWQSTGSFLTLTAGNYSIKVRDKNNPGCYWSNGTSINQPSNLNATFTSSAATSCTSNDASIIISSPSGGSGAYEYTIDYGKTWVPNGSFTNLSGRQYEVTIRDKNNPSCFKNLASNLNLNSPGAINANHTHINVSTCGATDGSITILNAMGGSGIYEYSINGGVNWQTGNSFTSLSAGFFEVRVRDKNNPGCFWQNNIAIESPSNLNATFNSTNTSACGVNDGKIIISSPSGGGGTYEYSINGGATWQGDGNFLGLSVNSYDVRIRDKANPICFKVLKQDLHIESPAKLEADISTTNISACGANDGIISITNPSGGSGVYEYTINGGINWSSTTVYSNLLPGTYNAAIRDKNNPSCVSGGNIDLTTPAQVNATVNSTNVICNGINTGTISILNPAGGGGTYQYSINAGTTWQNTGNYTNLPAGTYNVRIRDAANTNCVSVLKSGLTIFQPTLLGAVIAKTDVNCNGASNGSITLTNSVGGSGAFEYSIDGGLKWQTANAFTGLPAGTYNVVIRDAANPTCKVTLNGSVILSQPPLLSAGSISPKNVTCKGANDGSIKITAVKGGSLSYEFSKDGGLKWQSDSTFSVLAPGTYDIRVRDFNQPTCIVALNGSVVITEPALLTATFGKTNPTSCLDNDGKITITGATGGLGTYEYSKDGGTSWQSSGNYTGLASGTYSVKVRDAVNTSCVVSNSATITKPADVSASASSVNVTVCNGNNNGSITLTNPVGGSGTYQYSIDGGTNWQTSASFTGLTAKSYDVRVRDANSITCAATVNSKVVITEPAILSGVVAKTDLNCFGAANGSIAITNPVGGSGTYEYSKDGGVNWQTGATFTGLAAATYNVMMRDAANPTCKVTLNGSIILSQPPLLSAGSISSKNVTCNGANDGSIKITAVKGGSLSYEFSKDGGINWQSDSTFSALAPGTYNIRLRDAKQTTCFVTLNGSLVITQPAILAATFGKTNPTSCLDNDGKITITGATGGLGTYEYSKDGGTSWQSSGSYTGLASGTYSVKVRDAVNTSCVVSNTATITKPADVSASASSVNVTVCNGNNNGSITLTNPVGGSGTYQYSIDGGTNWQTSASFTGLTAKSYDVRVRDANSITCAATVNSKVVITEPAILSGVVAKTDLNCFGAANGSIAITYPVGGSGNYEYSKDGGVNWQTGATFTGLAAATYNIMMRDAANPTCKVTLNGSVILSQPPLLSAGSISSKNVTCNGANDGSIKITAVKGGSLSYEFSKDGGINWQSDSTFSALAPGTYNIRLRDAKQTTCFVTLNGSLTITQPAILAATFGKTNSTSCVNNDGSINITGVSGGSGFYKYSINGGKSWKITGSFAGLSSGNYSVILLDSINTNCSLAQSVAISAPDQITATVSSTNVTGCFGGTNGSITLANSTGGSGNYEYSKDGGSTWQTNKSFTNLVGGIYDLRMRDANSTSCATILNSGLTITQPIKLKASVSFKNTGCNTNVGSITISNSIGGSGNYEYSINGGTTWASNTNLTGLSAGKYKVVMRDAATITCVDTLSSLIEIAPPITLAVTTTTTNVKCNGGKDGSITILATGGSGTYKYSLDSGLTWRSINKFDTLKAGSYKVTVGDQSDMTCIYTAKASINQPDTALSISMALDSAKSSFTVKATGGTKPYLYQFDKGSFQQNNVFVDSTKGKTHTFTVKDSNNCTVSKSDSIPGVTAADGMELVSALKVYPVPSSDQVMISIENVSFANGILSITDLRGEIVYTENVKTQSDNFQHHLNLGHFRKGMYLVMIKTSKQTYISKIILK